MQEITKKERLTILDDYKYYKDINILYWYMKIIKRLDYLKPLIDELNEKQLNLKYVSNDLYDEVIEINEIKKLLESINT